MAAVSFMARSGTPVSQSDLLSLSLPAMSLSLAITANLIGCFRSHPLPQPASPEMEAEVLVDRGDLYHDRSFQQRPTLSFSDTSRLHLLGSPLNEDSPRIWESED